MPSRTARENEGLEIDGVHGRQPQTSTARKSTQNTYNRGSGKVLATNSVRRTREWQRGYEECVGDIGNSGTTGLLGPLRVQSHHADSPPPVPRGPRLSSDAASHGRGIIPLRFGGRGKGRQGAPRTSICGVVASPTRNAYAAPPSLICELALRDGNPPCPRQTAGHDPPGTPSPYRAVSGPHTDGKPIDAR